MPHGAIKYMTHTLYDVIEGVWMDHEHFNVYYSVFEVPPSGRADWRLEYCNLQDPLLKGVYNNDDSTIQEILNKNIAMIQENMSSVEV